MLLLDQRSPCLQVFGYMHPFKLTMPLDKCSEVRLRSFLIEVSELGQNWLDIFQFVTEKIVRLCSAFVKQAYSLVGQVTKTLFLPLWSYRIAKQVIVGMRS